MACLSLCFVRRHSLQPPQERKERLFLYRWGLSFFRVSASEGQTDEM